MTKKNPSSKYSKISSSGSPFKGNGMSRTAMIYKIATMAEHKLTIPEMNRIKDVDPRTLERLYDEVLRKGDKGNAQFALNLLLE